MKLPYIGYSALIITLATFFLIMDLMSEKNINLFQRSGSLIVIISLYLSAFDMKKLYKSSINVSPDLSESIAETYRDITTENLVQKLKSKINTGIKFHLYFYLNFGIIGTLIWGYGDLLVGLLK